jgi:hypothetical protein
VVLEKTLAAWLEFLVLDLGDLFGGQRVNHTQHELSSGWTWTSDATVFFGYNDQQRKFTDFRAWESQNWFMLSGGRAVAGGRLRLESMLSLEPFTVEALGSPQVLQTGEAYQGAPNIDRQHPHDLLMGLGAMYRIERGRMGYTLEAHLVGPPALVSCFSAVSPAAAGA